MTLVEAIQRKLWEADENAPERSWGFVTMKRRGDYLLQAQAVAAYLQENYTDHAEELKLTRHDGSYPKLEGAVEHTQPCALPDNTIGGEDMHTCGYKRGSFAFYPAHYFQTEQFIDGPAWVPPSLDASRRAAVSMLTRFEDIEHGPR